LASPRPKEEAVKTAFIRLHHGEVKDPEPPRRPSATRPPALLLPGMAWAAPSAEAGAGRAAPPRPRGLSIGIEVRGRSVSGAHSQEGRRGGRLSLPFGVPIGEVLPPGLPGGAIARSVARQRSEPDSETAIALSRADVRAAGSESCGVHQPMETPQCLPRMSCQMPAKAATK
jgi:hypothetical protein